MALQITITDAGRAEVINAANNGTAPVLISAIGIGTGKYIPDPAQTTLQTETKQLLTIAGQAVSSDTIHVTIKDETTDVYDVSEIGLYTDSGTLFAVYSDDTNSFMQKTAQSALMLSVDIILGTLDATNLTFGDTSFSNPPASETVSGVAKIASQLETDAGTDDTRIVTPKKLRWGFSYSFGSNGYITLPSWLGGFIFQWGNVGFPTGATSAVTFPITFPNQVFNISITQLDTTIGGVPRYYGVENASISTSGFTAVQDISGAFNAFYFSIGN